MTLFVGEEGDSTPVPTLVEPRPTSNWLARDTARAAVNWPSRTWGALDALLAAGSVALAHHLSPSYSFTDTHTYAVGGVAATFALLLLLCSYVLVGHLPRL